MTLVWSFIRSSFIRKFSILVLTAMTLVALLGLFWTPYNPIEINIPERLQGPSWQHWLGTDQFGRDLLSRLMFGASVSFRVSALVVVLALSLGFPLGLLSGYWSGAVDRVFSAFSDALLALPGILLALALISVFGGSEQGVILALGLAYTPYIFRVTRSGALNIAQSDYIEAARLMGRSELGILCRHIAPNVVGPMIVVVTSYFAHALLSESALSFLGLGVPPPYPSWGGLLAEARPFMIQAPWLSIFPGLAITLTLLSINLLGDAVRDILDPRTRDH